MPKAALLTEPESPVELREFPAPDPEPGGVVVETIYSEICGTDVHLRHGRLDGVPYPIIPGHVSVGRVLRTGGDVTDVDGTPVEPGSLVTFYDVSETCHDCWYCLVKQQPNRCPSRKVYGITYSADDGLLGGWSEQLYLKPSAHPLVLPDSVTPEQFIAAGCGLPTAIHALDRAELEVADQVVVQGAGPVGIATAVLALRSCCAGVYVVDKNEQRLEAARQIGVDGAVLHRDDGEHLRHIRRDLQGPGADVTIEATGAPPAIREGITLTRDGGRYVVAGHYTDNGEISLNPHTDINRKHLDIRGVWGSDFRHFYRALQILETFGDGVTDGGWEQLITDRFSLDELDEGLDVVESGDCNKVIVEPN